MKNISKIVVFYTDGTVDEVPYFPNGYSGDGGGGYDYYRGGDGGGGYDYYRGGGNDLNTYNPSVCPKCGIHLQALMSYSCPNLQCPTGMGPTSACISKNIN